jgi:hypothetical protein
VLDRPKNKMTLADKALDSIGVAQVRANLATNVYLGNDRAIVVGWPARHDEASSAEQLNLSRSAVAAAKCSPDKREYTEST